MSNRKIISFGRILVIVIIVIAVWLAISYGPGKGGPFAVTSPDGNLVIAFRLESKPQPYLPGERAYYRVSYKGNADSERFAARA